MGVTYTVTPDIMLKRIKVKRLILVLILFFYYFVGIYARQEKVVLRFDNTTWDFGCISEVGDKVTHTFNFTNIHTSSIVIEEVLSTCGCTISSYSKQPIKPGETGAITITFDPKGQADYISKTIRVVCNSGQSVNILKIKGTIHIATHIDKEYPYSLSSDVVSDKLTLFYGQLQQNGKSRQLEIKLYNRSMSGVKLSYVILNKSGCLDISMPSILQGHSFGTVKITAFPLKGFYGTFNDKIIILINSVPTSPIQIWGTVIDDMRNVSLLTAPRIKCSQSYFKLETISTKKCIQRKVRLTNEGKTPLIIHKIECPKYISTNFKKGLVLNRGEYLDVLFDLDSSLFRQFVDEKVKIITNDVQRPIYTIVFEGQIRN